MSQPPHLAAPPLTRSVQPWFILAIILLADIVDLLDATITTIAAPSIASTLGGGAGLISWLGASYALSMGVLLVPGGRLGDKFGRKRLFLIGIVGFTAASVAILSSITISAPAPAAFSASSMVLDSTISSMPGFAIFLASLTVRAYPSAFPQWGEV